MREALRQVKQELGEDAVILSNKKVGQGVELMAAIDHDAINYQQTSQATKSNQFDRANLQQPDLVAALKANQSTLQTSNQQDMDRFAAELQSIRNLLEQQLSGLAWGQSELAKPNKVSLVKRLMQMGLSWELAQELVADVETDPDQAWSFVLQDIESRIPNVEQDIIEQGGVVALVGPTGVGKTTTIAKIASRFVMRFGARELALITTDCYKIGAQEQLRTFADLIGVPVYVANTKAELDSLLDALSAKRLVLVDTAGMSQRDLRLSMQLTAHPNVEHKVQNYLVLAAGTQLNVMRDIVNSFGKIKLTGCILTKIDEALQLGNVVSVLIESGLPMAYVSEGQRVPEDLQKMGASELIDRTIFLASQAETNHEDLLFRIGMGKELVNGQ